MDTAEYNPHKMAADALIDEIDDMDMPALIKSVPDLYEYIPDLNSVELAQVKAAFLTRAEKIGDKKLIQSIMSSCEKKIKKAERSDTIRYNREVQPAFLEFTDKGAPKESINNPNDLALNKFDEENVKEKARAKALAELKKEQGKEEKEPVQISLTWKISLHRYAVFCGTAADESLKGWQLNFAGILSDYETNVARKKFLKMSDDFNTPIPVPEEEKNTVQEAK